MQLICSINLRLRFFEPDSAAYRISRINNSVVFVLHTHIQRGMVRKPVREQRVRAHISWSGDSVRDSNRFLPDRPRIGHLKNLCSGVKKLPQIGEINMRTNVIGAEVLHRIQRSKIDPLRDLLPSLNLQRRLSAIPGDGRDRLTFASAHLEAKPGLTISIMEIDIAA